MVGYAPLTQVPTLRIVDADADPAHIPNAARRNSSIGPRLRNGRLANSLQDPRHLTSMLPPRMSWLWLVEELCFRTRANIAVARVRDRRLAKRTISQPAI